MKPRASIPGFCLKLRGAFFEFEVSKVSPRLTHFGRSAELSGENDKLRRELERTSKILEVLWGSVGYCGQKMQVSWIEVDDVFIGSWMM